LEHVPLGESNALPYCGNAQLGSTLPLCSVDPVAVPPCTQIRSLGRRALTEHAQLLAYQHPAPIVTRGDESAWPGACINALATRTLIPTTRDRRWATSPSRAVRATNCGCAGAPPRL